MIIKRKVIKIVGDIVYYLVPIILVVLFQILGLLNYNMADDYIMNTISAGFNNGSPNQHIIFINGIYGMLVKYMYILVPDLNWFGIGYIITMLLCIYSLMGVIIKIEKKYNALLIVTTIEIISLLWMTFTFVAYLCVVTGIIMFVHVNVDDPKKKKPIIEIGIALLLEWLGIIFRIEAFFSGIIVCLPLFILSINKQKMKKVFLFMTMVVLLFVVSEITDNAMYNSNIMNEYKNYNKARSNVLDFPMKDYNEISYISEVDYQLLDKWILSDKKVFSESLFKKISKQTRIVEKYNFNIIDIVIQMIKLKECWFFLVIIAILLIKNRNNYKYYVMQAVITYGVVATTFFRNRPVHRVIVPLFVTGILCALIYFINGEKNTKNAQITIFLVLVVSLPLIALYVKMGYGIYMKNICINEQYSEVKEFIQDDENTLYLTSELGNLFYHSGIMSTKTDYVYDNIIGLGDWNIYNDVYYDVVRKYNLTYDDRLIIDLVRDNNIKCILKETDGIAELLKKHIEEQTGKKVEYRILKKFDKSRTAVYEYAYLQQ